MTVDNYVLIACSNSSDSGKWFEMEIGGKKDRREGKRRECLWDLLLKGSFCSFCHLVILP